MILAIVIFLLVIISVVISYTSLIRESKKQREVAEVKEKLAKGRVLYYYKKK